MFDRRRTRESGLANVAKAVFGRAAMTNYLLGIYPAARVAEWAEGKIPLSLNLAQLEAYNSYATTAWALFAAIVFYNRIQKKK